MADYTDRNGKKFTAVSFINGNPLTQTKMGGLSDNEEFFKVVKSSSLPGTCSTAVEATAEGGGRFHIWNCKRGNSGAFPLVDVSTYGGAVTPTLSDTDTYDGWKNRLIFVECWYMADAVEATALAALPGGASPYVVFGAGDGKDPDFSVGCYVDGVGGSGNYDIKVTDGNYTFHIYGGASSGDLMCSIADSAANDYVTFYIVAEFGPKMVGV